MMLEGDASAAGAPEGGLGPRLSKGYEHREVEARWSRAWKEGGYFHADATDRSRPPFSIVLPPPNVTGSLHLGHALTATIQDLLARWKRMSGFNTLWLPGTDHAGIATQMIVEKELQRTEGVSRHDLGRAEFLKRVWAWKEKYGSRIAEQHEALGASLDWERERFTMDEGLSRAVREVFVRLHEEGLVYRERKLINWCPRCRTALSDLEVTRDEAHQGELWSFAYQLSDGSGEIVVATTRPETMLGDTAVAVHPEDERYRHLVGKKVVHPLIDREIPIVADAILVDPAFGTGAVKVTPAHDFNDFEVGKRHDLELLTVIDLDGTMNAEAGPVAGMDRFEARRRVKELIVEKGLDRGTKAHVLPLGKCQRCETVLEPLLSQQWFVKIAPLAGPAVAAVQDGSTRFIPEGWTNTYMAWMRDIHDWCISRQLWWGHQIPAWYCADGHVTVDRSTPPACSTCGKGGLRQDEDVLDTWFSSALWPFSTMGWPEKTDTLRTFYPTSVMETGHDIIFFWVARMMMMGLHFMGEVPFRVVYLHPMVRDEKGQKMSKTKGNVIDPLVITERYGADALRFTLAALTAQGRDLKLATERIEGYRAFANKLWNATRFALMNLQGFSVGDGELLGPAAGPADRWILARLQRAVNETLDALEGYRFNDAAAAMYAFVWHELCDWYIELAKEALYGDEPRAKRAAQSVLTHCLDTALRLLHPVMPFVTEELWQTLKSEVGLAGPASIMIAPYPSRGEVDEAAERGFGPVLGIIDALRNIRGEMNIPFKTPLRRVQVGALGAEAARTVEEEWARISRLANLAQPVLHLDGSRTRSERGSAVAVGSGFEVRVPLAGVVDTEAESARIAKEVRRIEGDLGGLEKKLSNPSFVSRAPAEVVEKDRARAEELRERLRRLRAHRDMLAEAHDMSETEGRTGEGSETNASTRGEEGGSPIPESVGGAGGVTAGTAAAGSVTDEPRGASDDTETKARGVQASQARAAAEAEREGEGDDGEDAEENKRQLDDAAAARPSAVAKTGRVVKPRAKTTAKTMAKPAPTTMAKPKPKAKAEGAGGAGPARKGAGKVKAAPAPGRKLSLKPGKRGKMVQLPKTGATRKVGKGTPKSRVGRATAQGNAAARNAAKKQPSRTPPGRGKPPAKRR